MRNYSPLNVLGGICVSIRRAAVLCCMSAILTAVGCSDEYDDSSLRRDIEEIKDRVTKLEEQVASLNSDYLSMQLIVEALQGKIGIEQVERTDDGCKIVLSDGSTIVIDDNPDADTPVICVKADDDGVYYWALSTSEGVEWLLGDNGEKLPVEGVTPVIGVDADGYWTVSYGNGAAQRLTDAQGNPIVAQGDSALFKEVRTDDDNVYITLNDQDSTTIVVPLSSAFSITIVDAPQTAEFEYDQTMSFDVLLNGVETVVITKPDHWRASLDETTLSITAPSAEHAQCAELSGQIALICFNSAALSKVTTLNVCVKEPEDPATPEITVPDDFSTGNVQKAVYRGKKVAEICLEFIRTSDGEIEQQMVVIYPVSEDKADLSKGIDVATGGSVVWNSSTNTVTYTAGTATAPIAKFYVSETGELLTSCDEPTEPAAVEPDLLVDVRGQERQSYKLTKIGTQYWLAESLRAEYYVDGTPLSTDWSSETGSYIYFNESPTDYKSTYGAIYNGAAVFSESGLAPDGWKIPEADDITALKNYVGSTVTGTKLKSTSEWVKYPGSNITGFNALPGGYYIPSSAVDQFGSGTPDIYFWTATELYDSLTKSYSVVYFRLYDLNTRLMFDADASSFAVTMHDRSFGHYVRCLKK